MNQGITQAHVTEKIQHIQQQHPDMQQRYFSLQLQDENKRQREKIAEAEEARKKIIDAQQEKSREQNKKGSENDPKHIEDEHDPDNSLMLEQGSHRIDIKA
ncbi:MAG: hypothetical protein WCW53_02000 [Syntrophales bacterium]|jgi:hypothetical protein